MKSDSRASLAQLPAACPCRGQTLDRLVRPAVLAVLAQQPLHGYRIVEQLGRLSVMGGHGPDSTGVYRALREMQRQGLVASTWNLSRSGPAKRSYRLTRAGQACLAIWVQTIEHYQDGLTELLALARAATGRSAPRACCGPGRPRLSGPRKRETRP